MRFYTIEKNSAEVPAVSFDGGNSLFALADLGFRCADINELIKTFDEEKMRELKSCGDTADKHKAVDIKETKLLSPIPRPMQDVVCLGINYAEHAVEADRFNKESFGGERPYTIYFSKRVNYAPGPDAVISAHEGYVDSLDYEAELGVVIGKNAYCVKREEAENYIFGYTIINDVSARNIQTRHKQWYLGKSLDGFTPIGPCIVTPDEIGDACNLSIKSYVNGELRQNSNTSHMIQTVAGAIEDITQGITLLPGSLIATGTPSGVGMGFAPPKYMHPGDVIECEIENIGVLKNTVG